MNAHDIPPLDLYEREAVSAISRILREQRKLIIAYSGGKDSTTVLMLALNAARALSEEGVRFPPILVTNGDTGIENPEVVSLVWKELAKARAFGRQHGFLVQAEIAHPVLNDTWAVSILSGRKIPTFPNSKKRDCTVMFKITPMERLRKRILKSEESEHRGGAPVTLIGTRFEESDGRATRMNERGETTYVPWEKAGSWFMSPIANWAMEDVWEFLGRYKNDEATGFTDAKDVWAMYADAGGAGGTCAVVADMATESLKKSRACGARFGCALCAAVGRDKSLEAMLENPKYDYMRNVNRIQRFISDTQWDWSRRNWVGRTIKNGYINIEPDAYSPAMLQELLRYCLTADCIEERATYRKGIPPRFQLVTQDALMAIDALWSMYGVQDRAFTAIKIWDDVYNKGLRYFPPELEPVKATPKPAARYLKVGANWDGDTPQMYTGLRDVLQEAFAGPGCKGTRELADGRIVMDVEEAPHLSFDPEGVEMFFQFEYEYVLRNFHEGKGSNCTAGFFHYVRLNVIATSNAHVSAHVDRVLKRTSWKHRQGLIGTVAPCEFLPRTISKRDMLADLESQAPALDTGAENAADILPIGLLGVPPALLQAKPYLLALHLG